MWKSCHLGGSTLKTEAAGLIPHSTQACAVNHRFSLLPRDMFKQNISIKKFNQAYRQCKFIATFSLDVRQRMEKGLFIKLTAQALESNSEYLIEAF